MAGRMLGGRYTVQDKVGTGGMAIVYRGLDNVLGRTVAVKTMLPQYAADPSFAARFKQEAQAAAALQSPYIVSVYDWGRDGDTYYIVMEYLRGTDLKSGIRKHGALDCRKVAQIGSQISQALSVAHKHDIIHRDIKPQNIMVQPDGNIKVMDFGIARAKNSHLTADNSVLGTAHYVSPEQTQGKDLGATSDLYSLGIVMYEAATGRVPFEGDDAISVALKQVNEQPVPPSQINPAIDAALEGIILKCMQKDPADRFQTADELNHMLREYLAGRLTTVAEATSMLSAAPTTRMNRNASTTQSIPRVQNTGRIPAVASPQRHGANEEDEQEKRSKKNKAIAGVVIAIIAIIAIVAGVMAVTSQNEQRSVPNCLGISRDAATSQIKATNFFEVGTVKEEYSTTVASGNVISQDPKAGNNASKGTKINLVVSKGEEPAADVTVPDLTGKTPSEAEAALAKVNLKGAAGDSVFSDNVETGQVAAQNPAGNTTAKAGSTVTYQLSKGKESVEVPNVVGSSESSAVSKLEQAGFQVGYRDSQYSTDYDAGEVMSVSPTGSQTKGATIYITLSLGPRPKTTSSSSSSSSSSNSGSSNSGSSNSGSSSSGNSGNSGSSESGSGNSESGSGNSGSSESGSGNSESSGN